jgi:hypothetical protein
VNRPCPSNAVPTKIVWRCSKGSKGLTVSIDSELEFAQISICLRQLVLKVIVHPMQILILGLQLLQSRQDLLKDMECCCLLSPLTLSMRRGTTTQRSGNNP